MKDEITKIGSLRPADPHTAAHRQPGGPRQAPHQEGGRPEEPHQLGQGHRGRQEAPA